MDIRKYLLDKIVESLEQLNLDDSIIVEVEPYIDDEVDEEEFLNKLPKVDFVTMEESKMSRTINAYEAVTRYKSTKFLKKYIDILFQMGGANASYIVKNRYFGIEDKDIYNYIKAGGKKETAVALYSNSIVFDYNRLYGKNFKIIYEIIKSDSEAILKARKYVGENASMLLASIYCSVPNVKEDETFHKMIKEIEENFVASIGNFYASKMPKEIVDYINKWIYGKLHEMPESIIEKVKNYVPNKYLFRFLVGFSALNINKSEILKRVVAFFSKIDSMKVLGAAYEIMDLGTYYSDKMYNLDKYLNIGTKYYISWYAEVFGNHSDARRILEKKFIEDKESFKEAVKIKEKNISVSNILISYLIKGDEKEVYRKELEKNCIISFKKIISKESKDSDKVDACRKFLMQEIDFDEVYSKNVGIEYGYKFELDIINSLKMLEENGYGDTEFYRRCIVLLAIYGGCNCKREIFSSNNYSGNTWNVKISEKMFNILNDFNLPIKEQLSIIESIIKMYHYTTNKKITIPRFLVQNLIKSNTELFTKELKEMSVEGREWFLEVLFNEKTDECIEIVLSYFGDTSKVVRDKIVELFSGQDEYYDLVVEKLKARNQREREVAIKIIANWKKEEGLALLRDVYEKEKSSKIKELIDKILENNNDSNEEKSSEELVKKFTKGNKVASISWLEIENLSSVRWKDSDNVCDINYLKALLIAYSSLGKIAISTDGNNIAKDLNEDDLTAVANEVYEKWISLGAEAKKKWVLAFSAIYGGKEIVEKMKTNINEWPKVSRGAIASEAVMALALNGSKEALLIVDGISRKFKYRQVKNAAGEALEYAAEQLSISTEELSDKIVPNLEFDINGERVFDYGNRKFIVRLMPNLDIEVFDENDNKLKKLPTPGKRDDEEKAKKAYNSYKSFKKQLKTTITIQKARLDLALSSERKWSREAWIELFVNNPIMHEFAIGLIWGSYENNKLVDTFRYMEDGTFNTKDEDEYEIPEKCSIGLIHPLELSESDIDLWKEQIENYEIVQPINQLNRKVFLLQDGDKDKRYVDSFGGKVINGLSLTGKMLANGWYRGSVLDGGEYSNFYREDKALGIGADLSFEGLFVGGEQDDTTIYLVRFYKIGTVKRGSYVYDEVDNKNSLKLSEVPKKFFSEVLYQVDLALASSTLVNENWRKDAHVEK